MVHRKLGRMDEQAYANYYAEHVNNRLENVDQI